MNFSEKKKKNKGAFGIRNSIYRDLYFHTLGKVHF